MGTSAVPELPEAQGAKFEGTFAELLTRLLGDDLELTRVEVLPRSRGRQGGRDLQVKWQSQAGRLRHWHFECKSKQRGYVAVEEIAGKLMQEALTPHDIDVWCLAASDVEPSNETDDLLEVAPRTLGLDFALTAISPSRQGLKLLYSCYPDLYRKQYGGQPHGMTERERQNFIQGFGEWLEEWSDKRPTGGPTGWTHLTPRRVSNSPAPEREAKAYLRGLTVTCPWQAVVNGWSVTRTEMEDLLLGSLDGAVPGFHYEWLISAGGEGKSTVLRSLGWRVLNTRKDVEVLWADEDALAVLSPSWLGNLKGGSRVLMLVDGTGQFSGLKEGLGISPQLAERDTTVVLLMADRGNLWHRRRARQTIPSRARKPPLKLPPLSPAEQEELIGRLEDHGLLEWSRRKQAATMFAAAASRARVDFRKNHGETSWLVPTVLEAVDPEQRPFERILGSVLEELQEEEQGNALNLMLAIALLHAAGSSFPLDLAERLAGSASELEIAIDVLDQELERQLDFADRFVRKTRLVTHGTAVSNGFVRTACSDDALRRRLSGICRLLPGLMKPEYSTDTALREDRFEVLDVAARYLEQREIDPALAVILLQAWIELDPSGFPALHRLGNALLRWVQGELRNGKMEDEELRQLVARSRAAFEESLAVAERVLAQDVIPAPYRGYDQGKEERITFNSWAVLEATVGTEHGRRLGGDADLVRSVLLAMLSLEHQNGYREAVSIGLLARVLITLDEFELAAPILGYGVSLTETKKRLAHDLTAKLERAGVAVPEGSIETLAKGLEAVVTSVLVPNWTTLDMRIAAGPRKALVDALSRLSSEWGANGTIEKPSQLVQVPSD